MAERSPLEAYLECRALAEIAYRRKDYREALNLYGVAYGHASALARDMVDQMRNCSVGFVNEEKESPHA